MPSTSPPPPSAIPPIPQHPAAAAWLPALTAAATAHLAALSAHLLATEISDGALPAGAVKAWGPTLTRLATAAAALLALSPPPPAAPGLAPDPRGAVGVVGGDPAGRPGDSGLEEDGPSPPLRARLDGATPGALPALGRALDALTYAAWRNGAEAAWLADSLAATGPEEGGRGRGAGIVVAASAAAAARSRGGDAPILSASPHVAAEEGGGGGGEGGASFTARQRLWVCGMVAAPGLAPSPCGPPRLARLPFYSSAAGGSGAPAASPAWPARADVSLTAFVDRAWGAGRGGGGGGSGGGAVADPPASSEPASRPHTPSPLPPPTRPCVAARTAARGRASTPSPGGTGAAG